MSQHRSHKRKGLSLIEVMVVTGIMSLVGVFTAVMYKTAFGDYESSAMQRSMTQYARNLSNKISQIIATAVPRSTMDRAFYMPTKSAVYETDQVNFLSTGNFIKTSTTETSYAFDDGEVVPGYQPLFRYAIKWTRSGPAFDATSGKGPNTVYLERQNCPVDPTSGSPMDLEGGYWLTSSRQTLGTNIGYIGYKLTSLSTLQVRIVVYAVDPVTQRGLDGQLMRTMTHARRQNVTDNVGKVYELLTSIPIPTVQIK